MHLDTAVNGRKLVQARWKLVTKDVLFVVRLWGIAPEK